VTERDAQYDNRGRCDEAFLAGHGGECLSGHIDEWPEAALDYLEGHLDAGRAVVVEAHLASCPECFRRLEHQRALSGLLHELPLEPAPAELEERVLEAVLATRELPGRLATQEVPPSRAVGEASVPRRETEHLEPTWWSRLWHSRVRPWVPASIAVAALLLGILGYGLLRSGAENQADYAGSRLATTAAPATTSEPAQTPTPGETRKGAGSTVYAQDSTVTALGSPPAAEAESETTTTAAGTTSETIATATASSAETGYLAAAISDRKSMIAELAQVQGPVYFVFVSAKLGGSVSAETSEAVVQQLGNITGLEPLAASLALDGPTFAAYVPREDASALVDLLLSIKASLQLELHLEPQPPEATPERISRLFAHKQEFPVLSAHRTPAPAVSAWSFTTSTLLSPGDTTKRSIPTPDEDGSHVLVVILVRR